MKPVITTPRGPRSWIVLDIESAVLDDTAHRRYQAMERWTPRPGQPSRRGYKRSEDPLTCPRWPFQTITTAAVMTLVEHADGGIDVVRFDTFSAPEQGEREVLAGVLAVLKEAPSNAEVVTWAGLAHDIPLLIAGCMRHGLTLPEGWRWMAWGGFDRDRHNDLARTLSGGMKMKQVHLAEVLAAMDIPGKITAAPWAVTRLIYEGRWDEVACACEVDVLSTALLLARWKRLSDPRATIDTVEDRILRRVVELRSTRSYAGVLQSRRKARFAEQLVQAANDAARLAPWLDHDAA